MHKWKQTNQIHNYLQWNNAKTNSTINLWNQIVIQIQEEEPLLLGLGPNPRASALWVNSVLAQNKIHSYFQNNGLHQKLSQVLQLENRVEFYNQKYESY